MSMKLNQDAKRVAPQSKIMSWTELSDSVSAWKRAGDRIVFTNGCFDILHKGHADYLYKAACLGNRLVIGVNTDASIAALKGSARPIQDESSRTLLLASLGFVDAVCLFGQDTPFELIKQIIPHVLVKGKDYQIEDIVGADLVLAAGGKVETLDFIEGYSSSLIIKKIIQNPD